MRKLLLFAGVAGLLLLPGCRKESGRAAAESDKDKRVEQRDSVRRFPLTPDMVLFDVEGDVAYVVCERFDSGKKLPEEKDSISFTDDGKVQCLEHRYGHGKESYVIYDIRLKYNSDGDLEEGKERVTGLPVVLERNDSLQIVKFGVKDREDSPESAGFMWEYVWEGVVPVRKEEVYIEHTDSRRYKYSGDSRSPVSVVNKISDMGGVLEEDCEIEYLQFDAEGNWTERRVKVKSREYEYNVDSGRVEPVGESKRTRYIERRRIGYRRR